MPAESPPRPTKNIVLEYTCTLASTVVLETTNTLHIVQTARSPEVNLRILSLLSRWDDRIRVKVTFQREKMTKNDLVLPRERANRCFYSRIAAVLEYR